MIKKKIIYIKVLEEEKIVIINSTSLLDTRIIYKANWIYVLNKQIF